MYKGAWVLRVSTRKIRDLGENRGSRGDEKALRTAIPGYLINLPMVGRCMVVFQDPDGTRLITTVVTRILGDGDGVFFIETENSIYQLRFQKESQRGTDAGLRTKIRTPKVSQRP